MIYTLTNYQTNFYPISCATQIMVHIYPPASSKYQESNLNQIFPLLAVLSETRFSYSHPAQMRPEYGLYARTGMPEP